MPTVADKLVERLREWEVDQLFAYLVDGVNGLLAHATLEQRGVQTKAQELLPER